MDEAYLNALSARFEKAARSMAWEFDANRCAMLAARKRGEAGVAAVYELAIRRNAENLDRWEKKMAEYEEEKAAQDERNKPK